MRIDTDDVESGDIERMEASAPKLRQEADHAEFRANPRSVTAGILRSVLFDGF
jgi:hypothetical protein